MPGLRNSKIDQISPRCVLDRRAADGQAMPAAQEPGGLGRLALGVLDRLGLVEHDVVELEVGQLGDVGASVP